MKSHQKSICDVRFLTKQNTCGVLCGLKIREYEVIVGGDNVVCSFEFITSDKFAKPPHVSNYHQNIILEFLDFT